MHASSYMYVIVVGGDMEEAFMFDRTFIPLAELY
jgi:hypothetical protein